MSEFLIGMGGAVVGCTFFILGDALFYFYGHKKRQQAIKDFETSMLDILNEKHGLSGTAKVYPFKNPHPPKIN